MLKRLSLRIPMELYARLAAIAKAERRSLHAQILLTLEQAVKAKKGQS